MPWEPEQDQGYYYSLDVAKANSIDPWTLTIGKYDPTDNHVCVVAYMQWAGSKSKAPNVRTETNPNNIVKDVLAFREIFPCLRIYVDATSDDFFAHYLENEHLFNVEPVVWSTTRKELLIEHLSSVFNADKITIPNDTTMVSQLIDYAYDLKRMPDESEKRVYLAGQDDFVDSLAMLAQVVTTTPRDTFYHSIEAIIS